MVLQALLGFTSEARWLRYANSRLRGLFPYLPTQSGYNKRVRAATGDAACGHRASGLRAPRGCTDNVWVVDSTPVECGRSRETAKRSDLAGWAEYGYCASHSRFFWGLRLHLVCALSGLPVAFALTGAKADEREILLGMLDADPNLLATHPPQTLMADKNYYGRQFEPRLADARIKLLRPARAGEKPRAGQGLFKPFRHSSNRSTTPSRAIRPRTPRRTNPRRSHHPSTATNPRPRRRHLAQPTEPGRSSDR